MTRVIEEDLHLGTAGAGLTGVAGQLVETGQELPLAGPVEEVHVPRREMSQRRDQLGQTASVLLGVAQLLLLGPAPVGPDDECERVRGRGLLPEGREGQQQGEEGEGSHRHSHR